MLLEGERNPNVESEFRRLRRNGAFAVLGGIALALTLTALLTIAGGDARGEPHPKQILYPVFAMFFLVASVETITEKRGVSIARNAIVV